MDPSPPAAAAAMSVSEALAIADATMSDVAPPAAADASASAAASAAAAPAAAPSSAAPPQPKQQQQRGGRNNDRGGNKRQKREQGGRGNDAEGGDEADADADEDGAGDAGANGSIGGKKRKVALGVMYRGSAYSGLQVQTGRENPSAPTIERVLLDALYAAGGISARNFDDVSKFKWMRAARTDKGVHAAGNIMSLNLLMGGSAPPTCASQSDDIVDRVNASLPSDIRVIGVLRVLAGFHAKYACTSRVYEYIIPSFVFDERPESIAAMHAASDEEVEARHASGAAFAYPPALLDYRLSDAKKEEIRDILRCMKGTHNFQNFTRKKSAFLKEGLKARPNRRRTPEAATAAAPDATVSAAATDAAAEGVKPETQVEAGQAAAAGESADATAAAATPAARTAGGGNNRKRNREDDVSEDDREGLDDEEEEALERAQFAQTHGDASQQQQQGGSSALSNFQSPFRMEKGVNGAGRRTHNPLLVSLKSTASSKGGDPTSQTNKVSGQYARFIRYIIDFDIEETYLYQHKATEAASGDSAAPAASSSSLAASSPTLEFVRFRIHGQSFMLNQIRKMIGIVVAIARGQLPRSYLTDKALAFDDYAVPTAPSLGLLLQRPVYDSYDKKVSGIADRPPIAALFTQEPYASQVRAFREQFIYGEICRREVESASAFDWCSRLWDHPAVLQQQQDEQLAKEEKETAAMQQQQEETGAAASTTDAEQPAAAQTDAPAAAPAAAADANLTSAAQAQ